MLRGFARWTSHVTGSPSLTMSDPNIGRTWTAFYDVYEEDGEVGVLELLSIDEAHQRYGF